jgi:hypothetical protein
MAVSGVACPQGSLRPAACGRLLPPWTPHAVRPRMRVPIPLFSLLCIAASPLGFGLENEAPFVEDEDREGDDDEEEEERRQHDQLQDPDASGEEIQIKIMIRLNIRSVFLVISHLRSRTVSSKLGHPASILFGNWCF